MTYSGPIATYGHQADIGIETWIKAHGDTIAGRKIEFIRKDDTGLAPDVSKRVTQELAVRDKADIIFGGCWSPNAFASAPIVTAGQDFVFHHRRGDRRHPGEIALHGPVSLSVSVPSYTIGKWAAETEGWKTGYNAVADYVLGTAGGEGLHQAASKPAAARWSATSASRWTIPTTHPTSSASRQAHPQVVQLFMPAGAPAEGFVKAYHDIGLAKDGINLLTGALERDPADRHARRLCRRHLHLDLLHRQQHQPGQSGLPQGLARDRRADASSGLCRNANYTTRSTSPSRWSRNSTAKSIPTNDGAVARPSIHQPARPDRLRQERRDRRELLPPSRGEW